MQEMIRNDRPLGRTRQVFVSTTIKLVGELPPEYHIKYGKIFKDNTELCLSEYYDLVKPDRPRHVMED